MQRVLFIVFFVFILSHLDADASDIDSNSYQRIDLSYCISRPYNSNRYKEGASLQLSYGLMLNRRIGLGLGFGYQELRKKSLVPVFIEAVGYKKEKRNTPLVKMQMGYAIGYQNNNGASEDGYKFKAGIFLDAGIGKKFRITDDISVCFHCSYRFQFAQAEYKTANAVNHSEILNYNILLFSLGLLSER